MRSEKDIRLKIDSLLQLAEQNVKAPQYYEAICCQADILMWVLEYEEGEDPLDERRIPNAFIE